MGKQLEKSVEDYLVDAVKARGGMALKGDVPGQRFLDRIVIMPGGVTVYVECKRPIGGVHTAHQDETLERLEKLGHRVARIKTRQEVDELMASLTTPAPATLVGGATEPELLAYIAELEGQLSSNSTPSQPPGRCDDTWFQKTNGVMRAVSLPIELHGVALQLVEGGGAWISCTGCHETSEGVPTGPYSELIKCHLGLGCRECGGIGAVWDNTDWSALATDAEGSTE